MINIIINYIVYLWFISHIFRLSDSIAMNRNTVKRFWYALFAKVIYFLQILPIETSSSSILNTFIANEFLSIGQSVEFKMQID